MEDRRGVRRGGCKNGACTCDNFVPSPGENRCGKCKHPPGHHERLPENEATSNPGSYSYFFSVSIILKY